MESIVITVTSGKGGVGKTTSTANIGCALAQLGRKVCITDGDIGLRNLDIVMGLENRIVYDSVDVVEGRCKLKQALIRDKRLESLFLLPAAQTRDKTAMNPQQMTALCDQLREDFEFILIDSPAGIEQGFQTSIAPADKVLVITNPEVSSVRDADRVIGLVESAGKGPAQLIINRIIAARVARKDMLSVEDIMEVLTSNVIGIVPEDEEILSASNRGSPVAISGKGAAAMAYRDIARRINGENLPVQMPRSGGLLHRIFGRA